MNDNHEHVLMNGKFSVVSKALYNGIRVAKKKPTNHERALRYFENEITFLRSLTHPNIVTFLTLLGESLNQILVMELMPDGNLEEMIKNSDESLSLLSQYSIALDIAESLHYLHELHIIHRDLKPANILLHVQQGRILAKLCDFGFATSLDRAPFYDLPGTSHYYSPELLMSRDERSHPYSKSSDTYAFGLTLWSLASKKTPPFATIKNFAALTRHVHLDKREPLPDDTHRDFVTVITLCWATRPSARPMMLEIIRQLSNLKRHVSLSESSALSESAPKQSDVLQIKGIGFWQGSEDTASKVTSALERLAIAPLHEEVTTQSINNK